MREVREYDEARDVRQLPVSHEESKRSKADRMDGDKLGPLTRPEKFLINRRRNRETQKETAKKHGLSRNNYVKLEKGTRDYPNIPEPRLMFLLDYEKCIIYRRRRGCSQEQLSANSGFSRNWIRQMECGLVNCDALIRYWEC